MLVDVCFIVTWPTNQDKTRRIKPTLFPERGGRRTGERQTVPPKTERIVLLEAALETLEVALNWRGTVSAEVSEMAGTDPDLQRTKFNHLSWLVGGVGGEQSAFGGRPYGRPVQHVLLHLFALLQLLWWFYNVITLQTLTKLTKKIKVNFFHEI